MGRIEQIVEGRTDQTGCDEQNRQQRVERIRQDGKNRTDSRGQNELDRMGRIEQIVEGRTNQTGWEEQKGFLNKYFAYNFFSRLALDFLTILESLKMSSLL